MGLKNGTMLYLGFDSGAQPSRGDQQSKKQIAADGSIVDHRATQDANAFRPGLLSLRSQKMHWSLADMNDLDNQYTFTIKRHDKPMCARVSLDRASCNSFQQFCRKSAFQTARCGILYGHLSGDDEAEKAAEKGAAVSSTPKNPKHRRISDLNVKQPSARRRNAHGNINIPTGVQFASPTPDAPFFVLFILWHFYLIFVPFSFPCATQIGPQTVLVDCIYEPPQRGNDSGFTLTCPEDHADAVDVVAKALGMRRVGFIFSHPRRKTNGEKGEDFRFTGQECITVASQQLQATNGASSSSFVAVKVRR
jgi:hypothetical protein